MNLRDRWRAAVLRDPRISNATRVLLLVLHDYMRQDGYVSVPRSKLARLLDVHPARITERIGQATSARLLDVVERGRPGTTATYRALVGPAPSAARMVPRPHHADGRYAVPSDGPPSAPSPRGALGPPFGHPIDTTFPSRSGLPEDDATEEELSARQRPAKPEPTFDERRHAL